MTYQSMSATINVIQLVPYIFQMADADESFTWKLMLKEKDKRKHQTGTRIGASEL